MLPFNLSARSLPPAPLPPAPLPLALPLAHAHLAGGPVPPCRTEHLWLGVSAPPSFPVPQTTATTASPLRTCSAHTRGRLFVACCRTLAGSRGSPASTLYCKSVVATALRGVSSPRSSVRRGPAKHQRMFLHQPSSIGTCHDDPRGCSYSNAMPTNPPLPGLPGCLSHALQARSTESWTRSGRRRFASCCRRRSLRYVHYAAPPRMRTRELNRLRIL